MNKKGFTITEVLATLVILGVLIAIAIPSVSKLQGKFERDYYKELERTVLASAKTYFKDNEQLRPENILEASIVDYDTLITNKYIDQIKEYNSDTILEGYVVIVKLNDDYIYKNCSDKDKAKRTVKYGENHEDNLCYFSNEEDKVTAAYFLPNGYELVDDGTKIYLHVNNYSNDELREILEAKKQVVRKNGEEILYIVDLNDAIYPNNISALRISEASVSEEIPVTYKKPSESIVKTIVMYQHSKPELFSSIDEDGDSTLYIGKDEKLTLQVDNETFKTPYNSSFEKFQYNIEGGNWEDISCAKNEEEKFIKCNDIDSNVFLDKKVRFRAVGSGSKLEYGKPTDYYDVKLKEITVTFNPNEGSVSPTSKTVIYNSTYEELPTPTKSGYKFNGWYYEGDLIVDSSKVGVSSDHTLLADWELNEITVTFNANGGSVSPTSKTVMYNSKYGSLPTPTKSGYDFGGWYYEGQKIDENSIVNLKFNHELVAVWANGKFKVYYDGNGATSGSMSYTECEYLNSCKLQKNKFEKTGYTFAAWTDDINELITFYTDESYVTLGGETTLYAVWRPNMYSLLFNPNGGSVSQTSKPVEYNSTYGSLPTPTRDGYEFDGWYTSTSWISTARVSASTIHTKIGNQTLYAKWKANTYTVAFDANGGSVTPATKEVTYNSTYGELPTPGKKGYAFKGWYTATSGGTEITSADVYNETEDTILYAHWQANQYKVHFYINDTQKLNDPANPKTVTYNQPYGELPIPTRTGYTFDGWYTSSSGGYARTKDTKVTADYNHNIYAHWTEIVYAEPSIAPAVTGGSYQRLSSGDTIFTGGSTYYSLMVYDKDNAVNSVSISYNNGSSYTLCNTVEGPGKRSSRFDESFPEYTSYTRYYCEDKQFDTKATNNIKYKVTYSNSTKTKYASFILNTTDNFCPGITVSGTLGNNNWYTSTVSLALDIEANAAIQSMDWYTNTIASNATITVGSDYYKYYRTDSSNVTVTLSSSTVNGLGTRKGLIKSKDKIDVVKECKREYKIDAEKPTMNIVMKKLGTQYASNSNYKNFTSNSNYTSGNYAGNVLIYISSTSDGDSSKSGVATAKCSPSGADATRNSGDFYTYRNVLTYGTTTMTCTATDNAGNTNTYTKTISNTHTHEFGGSFNSITGKSYKNFTIKNYDYTGPGSWVCTRGHTHTYKSTYKAAFMTCVHCGKTAVDLGIRSQVGAWWCPTDARNAGHTEVGG